MLAVAGQVQAEDVDSTETKLREALEEKAEEEGEI